MTDEELIRTIKEVAEQIAGLSRSDKPLSKDAEKQKYLLLLQKQTLKGIKTAREKGDKRTEMENTIRYGVLTSQGEKSLLLINFIKSNLGPEAFC